MIRTTASERGICCDSCQEEVNLHKCKKCEGRFEDEDEIYCESQGRFDNNHYHILCKPKEERP